MHRTLVRADDHEMILVNLQVRLRFQKRFDKLIRRIEVVKAFQRNRVLHTRVMGIKSDDVGYSHVNQFLQCLGTVQRFAFGTFVLAAFVKKRHDDI